VKEKKKTTQGQSKGNGWAGKTKKTTQERIMSVQAAIQGSLTLKNFLKSPRKVLNEGGRGVWVRTRA